MYCPMLSTCRRIESMLSSSIAMFLLFDWLVMKPSSIMLKLALNSIMAFFSSNDSRR